MATIVRYRDDKPASVKWPTRIVSPTHASRCCLTRMVALGGLQSETHAHVHYESNQKYTDTVRFQYMRCVTCGFTVKRIVAEEPDAFTFASLRKAFQQPMFSREPAGAYAGRHR